MASFTHADFTHLAVAAFPDLGAEFEDAGGMVHLEMGAFARRVDEARRAGHWEAYDRGVRLADRLRAAADEELANAHGVSFLEHLEFDGPSGAAAWEWLPPWLQAERSALDAAMRDAAARAKELEL